jgi:hypothetical protein
MEPIIAPEIPSVYSNLKYLKIKYREGSDTPKRLSWSRESSSWACVFVRVRLYGQGRSAMAWVDRGRP